MKRCPYCAEEIQDAAIVCRFCQRDLQHPPSAPTIAGLAAAATSSASTPRASGRRLVRVLFVIAAVCVFGTVLFITAILLLLSPKPAHQTARVDETAQIRAQEARQIFNATEFKEDWANIAKRYGKTLAEVKAIAARGQREGWTPAPYSTPPAQKRQQLIAELERTGLLRRWSCIGNEAYINPLLWASVDVDAKRGIAATLAHSCADQSSGDRITIYDHQSGRKLARWGAFGFSVE